MSIIRSIFRTFENLSEHMVGQDVERPALVRGTRKGSDFAAISQIHAGCQGTTPLGLGR